MKDKRCHAGAWRTITVNLVHFAALDIIAVLRQKGTNMSTHTFTVPDAWQPLLDRQLAQGGYATTEEVLREALQQWLERRETAIALNEALDDVAQGRTRPWEEFVSEFRTRNHIAQ
jgi:Arc/MetJ-type ribon-helix-helix transcriptional regulator